MSPTRLFAELQRSIALGTPSGNPTGNEATYPALPDPLCKWGPGVGPSLHHPATII
jgi:hypothetical protein